MMTKQPPMLFPPLVRLASALQGEAHLIDDARKGKLTKLATYLQERRAQQLPTALNFICTHNSRRSHLSQIWAATAASYFGLENLTFYSGGTEATAFHPNAIAALERAGFKIEKPQGPNPHYQVYFSEEVPPVESFSKTFDDAFNPQQDFAAIMTCSEADANCPFVPGASWRLSLPYEDPKLADHTPEMEATYDASVREIGRELMFVMEFVHTQTIA